MANCKKVNFMNKSFMNLCTSKIKDGFNRAIKKLMLMNVVMYLLITALLLDLFVVLLIYRHYNDIIFSFSTR